MARIQDKLQGGPTPSGSGAVRHATPVVPDRAPDPERRGAEAPLRAGDETLVAIRAETSGERQTRLVEAVRSKTEPEGNLPDLTRAPPKKALDGVLMADGAREGVRIATSLDELQNIPAVGRAIAAAGKASDGARGTDLVGRALAESGRLFRWLPSTPVGQVVQRVVTSSAGRAVARIAPGVGVGVAVFDSYDAMRTAQNPRARQTEKNLATAKATLSTISGIAGVTAAVLAPTGVGAGVAGAVALVTGLSAAGIDFFLSRERAARQK